MKFSDIDWKKTGIFAAGVAFGTAGIKVLSSKDAKKVYTSVTAAALRAKDCVMKVAGTIQENAEDIYESAQNINEEKSCSSRGSRLRRYFRRDHRNNRRIRKTKNTCGKRRCFPYGKRQIMKFIIKHETKGRIRIHVCQYRMNYAQADTLLYFLHNHKFITFAKVYERTADAVISYVGDREQIIKDLQAFSYEKIELPAGLLESSGRELNADYQEKLVLRVVRRYAGKLIIPAPIRYCITTVRSFHYLYKGLITLLHRKLEVPVLDATAIGVSILRRDFETAGSVMFLLGIGELLEEWTHKKSVDDLARSLSLNVRKSLVKTGGWTGSLNICSRCQKRR